MMGDKKKEEEEEEEEEEEPRLLTFLKMTNCAKHSHFIQMQTLKIRDVIGQSRYDPGHFDP